jgi:hypothetical protein
MPNEDSNPLFAGHVEPWMLAFAALLVFIIYRRFRRNFGRQALRPARMVVRIALFSVIGLALLSKTALRSWEFGAAAACGIAIGVTLAVYAAKRTRFEKHDDGLHYIPHTVTGVAIFALFIGRLGYRLVELYSYHDAGAAGTSGRVANGFAPASMVQSPLTLGLFFVLIGYYVYYTGHLLWKSKRLGPQDFETPSVAA